MEVITRESDPQESMSKQAINHTVGSVLLLVSNAKVVHSGRHRFAAEIRAELVTDNVEWSLSTRNGGCTWVRRIGEHSAPRRTMVVGKCPRGWWAALLLRPPSDVRVYLGLHMSRCESRDGRALGRAPGGWVAMASNSNDASIWLLGQLITK